MKVLFTMRQALSDPKLLAHALPGETWAPWHSLLYALTGDVLSDAERVLFTKLTLRLREPGDGKLCEAFLAIAGRRGGKTKSMATLCLWLATCIDWSANLSIGERGRVMFVAPSLDQARVQQSYCHDILVASPKLRSLIKNETTDTIELRNGITIEVQAASAARSRGFTAVAIALDECAFLKSGDAVDSDVDLMTALKPSLATTRGPMLLTSTPNAPLGAAHRLFKKHFKADGSPLCLVANGATLDFNPSIAQSVIDTAYEDDPEAAEAEFGGKFRTPMTAYLPRAVLDRAIDTNIIPQHRRIPGIRYEMNVDMATGAGRDSAAYAVGHKVRDGDRDLLIFDELKEERPPFDPLLLVKRICDIARFWGCTEIHGDQYGKPFISLFAKHGINYIVHPLNTSEIYLHARVSWTAGNVVLPVFETTTERAVEQFMSLRRKVHPGGRETVEHLGTNSHDDLAVAISGVIYQCTPVHPGPSGMSWGNIGVFTGAPGGPISGPSIGGQLVDKPRTPEQIERREKARWSNGEPPPPPKYAGLVHGMGGVNPGYWSAPSGLMARIKRDYGGGE
jgi:hypothetical protein